MTARARLSLLAPKDEDNLCAGFLGEEPRAVVPNFGKHHQQCPTDDVCQSRL